MYWTQFPAWPAWGRVVGGGMGQGHGRFGSAARRHVIYLAALYQRIGTCRCQGRAIVAVTYSMVLSAFPSLSRRKPLPGAGDQRLRRPAPRPDGGSAAPAAGVIGVSCQPRTHPCSTGEIILKIQYKIQYTIS